MNSIATNWRALFVALLLVAGVMLPGAVSRAQIGGRVDEYTVTTPSLSYSSISGTTLVNASTASQDDAGATFSLPFNFNYDDKVWNSGQTMRVSTNGFLDFNSTQGYGSPYVDRVLNSTYNYPRSIYLMSHDMEVVAGSGNGIFWAVSGSSPNRVLTVEWKGLRGLGSGTAFNAQIKLYETTQVIEFLFSAPGTSINRSVSGGLHGDNTPLALKWKRVYGPQSTVPTSSYRMTPPTKFDMRAAVSPEFINFGTAAYGENSGDFTVNVTNLGLKDKLQINGAVISGTADFTIVSSPATNLVDPGQTVSYTLRFSPLAAFTRNGVLTVATNGLDSGTQTVNLTGFGLAPAVQFPENLILFRKSRVRMGKTLTQAIPVTSSGNGPLTITSIEVLGEYAPMYTWTRKLSGPIPPGVTDTVMVTFTALEEGLRVAEIRINTNAIQANPSATFKMNGLGILPRLYMTPDVVKFDSTGLGDTAWTTVRLHNPGTDTLAVRADYVTFFDKDFTYFGLEGADSLIYPETFRDVQIRFTPQMRGYRQGRLRFLTNIPLTFEDPRRDTSVYILDVSGVAVPYGLISIDGPTKTDSVIIGQQACQPITIVNHGQSSLTVNSGTFVGTDASNFALTGITFPATLAPGASLNGQLCATPSDRGLRSATLEVSANSADKESITSFAVNVHGLAVCAAPSTNIAFEDEKILVNTTSSAQIMVNNCGDVAAVYTATVNGAAYQLTSPATSASIAPGENATFDVTFMPTLMGDAPGTLTITTTGVADMVIDLGGIGGNAMIEAQNMTAPETGVGQTSASFNVTVRNTGNMDLTPGAPSISTSEFALVGTAPTTIAAGGEETYTFTFTPSAEGNRTASVTFPDAAPGVSGFMLNGNGIVLSVRPVAQAGYELGQNYPNPFNPSTQIEFTMAEGGNAQIIVSDVTGNVVATVADQYFGKGENTVTFDASNLASGTYFYELIANGVRLQRSMLLNK